jgi:RNA binding exosome subunit
VTNTENGEQVYRLIESLYTHVTDLFAEQNLMMQNMATELRAEMAATNTELRTEMADMKTELKAAIDDNGKAILRLEKEVAKIGKTVIRHDLDIQMLKKTFVETG